MLLISQLPGFWNSLRRWVSTGKWTDGHLKQRAFRPVSTLSAEEIAASKDAVLGKCEFFTDVHLWPLTNEMDALQWLQNFTDGELPYAIRLLDGFLFFSRELTDAMFVAGFQSISGQVARPGSMPLAVQSAWSQFCSDVIVTHVEGEIPSTTDSGYSFARRARQLLSIPEEQILAPDDALQAAITSPQRPVVFVDDFVGSGQQFHDTWTRERALPSLGERSFEKLPQARTTRFFYCPILCTRDGATYIASSCKGVRVVPVHYLDPTRDTVFGTESSLWSAGERPKARAIIKAASLRAGIPESGKDRWDGYEGLGLAVAFEHSVPDATLPIFYGDKNGWKPLIQRK